MRTARPVGNFGYRVLVCLDNVLASDVSKRRQRKSLIFMDSRPLQKLLSASSDVDTRQETASPLILLKFFFGTLLGSKEWANNGCYGTYQFEPNCLGVRPRDLSDLDLRGQARNRS